jgi:hypothetical protein
MTVVCLVMGKQPFPRIRFLRLHCGMRPQQGKSASAAVCCLSVGCMGVTPAWVHGVMTDERTCSRQLLLHHKLARRVCYQCCSCYSRLGAATQRRRVVVGCSLHCSLSKHRKVCLYEWGPKTEYDRHVLSLLQFQPVDTVQLVAGTHRIVRSRNNSLKVERQFGGGAWW